MAFKTDYRLMQVKTNAEYSKLEHSTILSTFIKLPFVIKIFVLSVFEWPIKTDFYSEVFVGKAVLGCLVIAYKINPYKPNVLSVGH